MKEKILEFFKKNSEGKLFLFFLSCIFSFCMFSYINEFVLNILPRVEITVSSFEEKETEITNSYIVILEKEGSRKFYNLRNSFLKNKNLKENQEGLGYIKKGDYGYSLEAIRFDSPKNKISIGIKKTPDAKISFYNIGRSKKILIASDKNFQVLDISENKEGEIIDYFPFKESKTFFVYLIISYMILGILIFAIVNKLRKIKIELPVFFNEYYPKKMTLIFFSFIIFFVSMLIFTNSLPKRLFEEGTGYLFGDQGYYWKMAELFKNGDFVSLRNKVFTFRGYVSSLLPLVSQIIGKVININPLYIYYAINIFIISIFLGYIMPEIYFSLTKKKPKNYQIMILFIIFFLFWRSMYYSVLTDVLSLIIFSFFILILLKYIGKINLKISFILGILISLSASYRTNYKYGIYFILVFFLVNIVLKKFFKKEILKINIKTMFFFLLGVFIVSIPQIIINYSQGYIGIFPYGSGRYVNGITIEENLINLALGDCFICWPYPRSDITAKQILMNSDNRTSYLSVVQALSAYAKNPLDSLIVIIKRIILALNIKLSEVYPDFNYEKNTSFYLFSFFNYIIISTGLYPILNKKIKNKIFKREEIILSRILIILFIFPQLIILADARYFILLYFILYYIVTFKFFEFIKSKDFDVNSYLKFLCISVLFFYLINSYYY